MHSRSIIFLPVLAAVLFSLSGKKEQLLQLSKKYFPENYVLIKEYDEASINDLAKADSPGEYISNVSTVVHEAYHDYLGRHSSYYDSAMHYRINDTLSFDVRNFKTFPSVEINNIVPAAVRKRVFRYDTYIDTKEKFHVTQQFGILGLLEEAVAYYHSFNTEILLFHFYKDKYGWKKPDKWMSYLGGMASFRFAITEFELFMSWYLQYAKSKHPSAYRDIITSKGLKKLVTFLHNENRRLSLQYDKNRQEILEQFKGTLEIHESSIFNTKTNTGSGLFDEEVKEMNLLLSKPEHNLYKDLLR